METSTDLGFVEDTDEKWRFLSHYFPCKLGGPPAWLSFTGIPKGDDLKCDKCGKNCKFLLQLYSPISSTPACFHRALFLFCCTSKGCAERSFKCLRSQLRRNNKFYRAVPPDEDHFDESEPYPKAADHQKLCSVCGCAADKSCAQCHSVSYCSKDHQILDWKSGHKAICSGEG